MRNLPSKASSRIALNTSLLTVAIGIFFLTINLREEVLLQKIVAIQLVLPIPLFLTSTLAYSKIGYRMQIEKWDTLGWMTFILGYAFLLNVIGILIGYISGIVVAMIFFACSWILAVIYSLVDITYNKSAIKERLCKDILFISIQFVFGVLVVLGFF
jgi:hypothetical protein